MHRFLILTAFALSASLIAPVAARADDRNHQEKRYYDKDGRDYHTWNTNEDRAYRHYLGEQHRDYRDFNRTKRTQQQQYFQWRHNHDDNTLFKVEIRQSFSRGRDLARFLCAGTGRRDETTVFEKENKC